MHRAFHYASFLLIGVRSIIAEGPSATRTGNQTLHLPESINTSPYITKPAFSGLKFDMAVAIDSPAGDTNRLFFAEKAGYVSVITNLASPTRSVFLDMTDLASHETEEAGLLGLAFHPGYATNGFFYVFYTTITNGAQRDCVGRFSVDPQDPNKALRDSHELILFQPEVNSINHNAGDLHFGRDGYLYISLGDPWQRMQQLYNFYSGMLRIDVDRRLGNIPPNSGPGITPNYLIPAHNPFIGLTSLNGQSVDPTRVRTEFWALGLRNPWRFCFDSLNGDLYCGDVGEWDWEEVNIIHGGKNYGWDFAEGPEITNPMGTNSAPPIYAYPHVDAWHAIIGGRVYRGSRDPELYGSYIFGDWGNGRIMALNYENGEVSHVRDLCNYPSVISFGTDPRYGDILVASADGTIRQIIRREVPTNTAIPVLLSQTGAFNDLNNLLVNPGIEPYDVKIPFWSDNAEKERWFMIPAEKTIDFNADENWIFPSGSTWIKQFYLETEPGNSLSRRKVETRFFVITDDGAYGLSYAWNESQTDATLVGENGLTADYSIFENGNVRTQQWIYPSRTQCMTCHTRQAGFALGFNTRQLNRDVLCENGVTNQIKILDEAGYFSAPVTNFNLLPEFADISDPNQSMEFRARSYLAANCSQCHQPLGVSYGNWDARMSTPLSQTGLLNGGLNDPNVHLVIPGSPSSSQLWNRLSGSASYQRMPPLATTLIDREGTNLIGNWIANLVSRPSYLQWKTAHLQNAEPSNEGADFDGDKASNYQEYLTDTDPKNPKDVWRVAIDYKSQQAQLTFPHSPNLIYEIQWTPDLSSNWVPLNDPINRPIPTATFGTTVVNLDTSSPDPRFFRVLIREP